MRFRAYGHIKDNKTDKDITGAVIRIYLNKEELQKGKSAENGFYEIIVEIEDSRLENGQQLKLVFEKEGYKMQEHHVLATEGSFNLDIEFEPAVAPTPQKSFSWLPAIFVGGGVLLLLIVGVIIFLILRPEAPNITSFSVDPNSIESGQSATLRWETSNAENVTILPDIGSVSASGTKRVSPSQTTTYIILARNKEGKTDEKKVQVEVLIPAPPRIAFFGASQSKVKKGEKSTLRWETSNAEEVTILPDIGSVDAAGTRTVSPSQTTTYIILARNKEGKTDEKKVQIEVSIPFKDGYYKIIARHSGKCIDVAGASGADSANVIQYGCHGGNNQLFKIESVGNEYYKIIARHSGKCIDVAGASGADSANVIQYRYHGGYNQLFKIESVGNGYYKIIARHSGKCIDVAGASGADSANVIQYGCHGGNNQLFKIEPI